MQQSNLIQATLHSTFSELPYYNYQVSSNLSGETLLDQIKHQPTPPGIFIRMSMVDVLLAKTSVVVVKQFLGLKTTLKEVRNFLEWNEEHKQPLQLPVRYLIDQTVRAALTYPLEILYKPLVGKETERVFVSWAFSLGKAPYSWR